MAKRPKSAKPTGGALKSNMKPAVGMSPGSFQIPAGRKAMPKKAVGRSKPPSSY